MLNKAETQSKRDLIGATSGKYLTPNNARNPTGILKAKIQCQLAIDKIKAPSDGPITDDTATVIAFQPIPLPIKFGG